MRRLHGWRRVQGEPGMMVAEKIGKYKKENNITILQSGRWDELLQERTKKAIKKGEEFDEEEYDSDMDMDLGGPESVIDLDINNERDNYLNPKYFKKYDN